MLCHAPCLAALTLRSRVMRPIVIKPRGASQPYEVLGASTKRPSITLPHILSVLRASSLVLSFEVGDV